MSKTSNEVCTEALRHIRVLGLEDVAAPAEVARAQDHLDSIMQELDEIHEMAIQWTKETVPNSHFLGISMALGGSLAPGFGKLEMAGERARGIGLLRDLEFKNDDDEPVRAEYF